MCFECLWGRCDLTDEAIASTMRRFNKSRRLWIVVQGIAQFTNCHLEDGVAHKRFRPNCIEEFLFSDQLTGAPDEIVDNCEGLRRSEERRVGKECRSRWWPYQ